MQQGTAGLSPNLDIINKIVDIVQNNGVTEIEDNDLHFYSKNEKRTKGKPNCLNFLESLIPKTVGIQKWPINDHMMLINMSL